MPFIGKSPADGNNNVLMDAVTTADNTAGYALTKDSVAYTPISAQSLMVSLNGVTQAPIAAYTVSGSTITFASNLMAVDVIDYIIAFEGPKVTATIDDGTITTAMINNDAVGADQMADDAVGLAVLSATGTADDTTFLRGDNTWAASGGLYSTWVVTPSHHTVTASGEQIICNHASTGINVTLPAGATGYTVTIKNVGAALVTVVRNGSEKINSVNENATMPTGNAAQLVWTGDAAIGWTVL